MKSTGLCSCAAALVAAVLAAAPAWADPSAEGVTVTVAPAEARPGDPVLVTVLGSAQTPKGKAAGKDLSFFAVRGGHQALFAVPMDRKPGELAIELRGGLPRQVVPVVAHEFPAADVTVPDEYANPPPEARKRIDDDNRAIRKAFGKPGDPPQFRGDFKQPVAGGRPTSPFGEQRTFNAVAKSQHLGLDVTARTGAKVKAIGDGTVVLVRSCFLPGNVVVVDHGAGIASAYFHLQLASVVEGDIIKRGTQVGRAGQTGRATGPHMHLSVWVPGGFVDPATFFRLPFRPPVVEPAPVPDAVSAGAVDPAPAKKASYKSRKKTTKSPAKKKSAK
ncbi:MAG TPA: M23 family metallopeptidase [Kofleriaceae bacterium]|nr:M23 family metallopeptidase [Kofleriaceae bacterium]